MRFRQLALFVLSALMFTDARATFGQSSPASSRDEKPQAQLPIAVADPVIRDHLAAWEKAMGQVHVFRTDFTVLRTDAILGKTQEWTGSLLLMRPNLIRLRAHPSSNPERYEAMIGNGKSLFIYDGSRRSVTEWRLAPTAVEQSDLVARLLARLTAKPYLLELLVPTAKPYLLELLGDLKASTLLERFTVSEFRPSNDPYLYLLLKARAAPVPTSVEEVRLSLFKPNFRNLGYLPALASIKRSNGEIETWRFQNPQIDLGDIPLSVFQYETPPAGWAVRRIPAEPRPEAQPLPEASPIAPVAICPVAHVQRVRHPCRPWRRGLLRVR